MAGSPAWFSNFSCTPLNLSLLSQKEKDSVILYYGTQQNANLGGS